MRTISAVLLSLVLLVGFSMGAQAELLDEATAGGASGVVAMSDAELDSVVGEGTVEKFVEIPNLARSFDRTVQVGENTLTISAEAGVGITLTASGPDVPSL